MILPRKWLRTLPFVIFAIIAITYLLLNTHQLYYTSSSPYISSISIQTSSVFSSHPVSRVDKDIYLNKSWWKKGYVVYELVGGMKEGEIMGGGSEMLARDGLADFGDVLKFGASRIDDSGEVFIRDSVDASSRSESLFKQYFDSVSNLFTKTSISPKSSTSSTTSNLVIWDVAIENLELDLSIPKNIHKIPKYIIDQYNTNKFHEIDNNMPEIDKDPGTGEVQDDNKESDSDKEKEAGSLLDYFKSDKPSQGDKEKEAESLLDHSKIDKEEEAKALLESEQKVDHTKEEPKDAAELQKEKEAEALLKAENDAEQKDSEAKALLKLEGAAEHPPSNEGKDKRGGKTDSSLYIPSKNDLEKDGWIKKDHGIWLRYGKPGKKAVTAVDVLFGENSVEPRPNWILLKDTPIPSTKPYGGAYLTFRKGPEVTSKKDTLKFRKDGKFKILQIADLHFSTGDGRCRDPWPLETKKGCLADPRTLNFLNMVLDIETPDFVVFTGDQIFGEDAPDSETALYKALYPVISRKIPYGVTLGNHDDEGSLNRTQIMELSSNLPYSLAKLGPKSIDGVGNYMITVQSTKNKNPGLALYFMDSHKYSSNPKAYPGYDWIKDSQKKHIADEFEVLKSKVPNYDSKFLSMAFFHIPLPEYRNTDQSMVGAYREGVTAPKYNNGVRDLLLKMDVKVASVGHDHCNEFCSRNTLAENEITDSGSKDIWLCYGGGSGEGGYGGYGGYVRKLRVFEIDEKEGGITSWKRAENDPAAQFDHQDLVQGGLVK